MKETLKECYKILKTLEKKTTSFQLMTAYILQLTLITLTYFMNI